MLTSLLAAALLMGLAGSPHCAAMCGAGCSAVAGTPRRRLAFHTGRLGGYALLGALSAGSAGALRTLAGQLTLLAPFWAMVHVALVLLGASLLWLGAQPAWLDGVAERVWRRVRLHTLGVDSVRFPLAAGALWTLLPCGLLWSAAMLAALANSAAEGALVMVVFAASSAIGLGVASSLLQRVRRHQAAAPWAVRMAGLAVMAGSGWALTRTVLLRLGCDL